MREIHRQVRALLQYPLIDLGGENSPAENILEKRFPQDHQSMNQSPSHISCRLLQDHTHIKNNNISFLKSCVQYLKRIIVQYHRYHSITTLFKLNDNCPLFSLSIFVYSHISFVSFYVTAAVQYWTYVSIENGTMIVV